MRHLRESQPGGSSKTVTTVSSQYVKATRHSARLFSYVLVICLKLDYLLGAGERVGVAVASKSGVLEPA